MRVLLRYENFSSDYYELSVGKAALTFNRDNQSITFSYYDISDFCVTHGKQGKSYFTMLSNGRILEGQILDAAEVEQFMVALRQKLGGIIHIEVKRN